MIKIQNGSVKKNSSNIDINSLIIKNNNHEENTNINFENSKNDWTTEINSELSVKSKSKSVFKDGNNYYRLMYKAPNILNKNRNHELNSENVIKNTEKSRRFLEKKTGVKLKRSVTKDIKIPQNTFNINPDNLPPFENVKDGLQKTLLKFENSDWEIIIEALQGVIRLTRHHNKQLLACLHPYAIYVSKEIRNLRSQVARAACLAAENIFRYMTKISDQDIEELSQGLFLRAVDTNKFLRDDSNKALDAMVEHLKFSKCIVLITQKAAGHPNSLIRATAARLFSRLMQIYGVSKILSLTKDKRDVFINTAAKFIMDGNSEARAYGRDIFSALLKDQKIFDMLTETLPNNVMISVNKILTRSIRK